MSSERKPRKDSKLHSLPGKQRAVVNRWLFDKGLPYQEVADACFAIFGLKVSKTSVGRYFEREARGKVRRMSGKANGCVSGEAFGSSEEKYQETLRWIAHWALEELNWPVEDERDMKMVMRSIRLLLAAKREANERKMVELEQEKFERKAAKEVRELLRSANGELLGEFQWGRRRHECENKDENGDCD
jgi:Protein of unknown function (DUF3486)